MVAIPASIATESKTPIGVTPVLPSWGYKKVLIEDICLVKLIACVILLQEGLRSQNLVEEVPRIPIGEAADPFFEKGFHWIIEAA